MTKRKTDHNEEKSQNENPDPERYAGPHVGSSDAFSQTENTASPDADNISDEKLDDWVNED